MKKTNNLKKIKSRAHGYRFTVGRTLELAVALVFLLFTGRMLYLSISKTIDGQDISKRTAAIYRRNTVLTANRGTIYDKNGLVIAQDSHTYTVYAILDKTYVDSNKKPLYVQNKKKTAEKLATVLPLSAVKIYKYLTPKSKSTFQVQFGTAGSSLTLTQKKKIQAMHLTGIKFMETPSRLYPNGVFASNVIGYTVNQTSKKTGTTELVGVTGLEAYFNKVLTGTNGYETSTVDSSENQLPSGSHSYQAAKDGNNLYLTIDSQLQRPTFNSQTKAGISKAGSNLLVQSSYEPGSVFKILSLSAAVNSGNYNPKEYYRSGSITVSGSTIYDWQKSGWGTIPFSQAFPRSSNVGMVYLEKKMGAKLWKKYLEMFRITHKTGITLPGEVSGSISFASPVDQAVTSFGQGVTVNVMQMMQVYSALANNGQMVKPQLVEKITDASGKTVKGYTVKKVGKPVFTAATRKVVMQNMKKVLSQTIGTGHAYYMKGKDFGIKTGTAQIAKATGGYMTGDRNYIFSVVGITPTDNPRYCIYITMKQPSKLGSGAETILSQIFKPMMRRLVLLSKGNKSATGAVTVPKLTGMTVVKAKSTASANGLTIVKLGTGSKVTSQNAKAGATVSAGSTVFVSTGGKLTMPDLTGYSQSQVEAFAELTGLKLTLSGSGKVKSQSLDAGTTIKTGTKLKVELKE